MSITYRLATKADKKDIGRFYKSQHYSASFKGFDVCLLALNKGDIVGIAIISLLEKTAYQGFLHGVVVSTAFQRQGIASQLIQRVIESTLATYPTTKSTTCFVAPELTPLYQSLHFSPINTDQLADSLSQLLYTRYKSYQKHEPTLLAFIKQHQ